MLWEELQKKERMKEIYIDIYKFRMLMPIGVMKIKYVVLGLFYAHCYLPPGQRPGTGDIATPPSVCLTVRPSVRPSVRQVSFCTVAQKRISVYSRDFASNI